MTSEIKELILSAENLGAARERSRWIAKLGEIRGRKFLSYLVFQVLKELIDFADDRLELNDPGRNETPRYDSLGSSLKRRGVRGLGGEAVDSEGGRPLGDPPA